ncbi:hypothetical protein EYC84_003630 [Monilinia fructicola]|uniref:Uncharacterized protein n=1 Tax=Monilinia fructicola TaxID=38448 RepID=A0A5M9K2H1_MONFR|nr:hypothetical protein EYC84_003630 [Monilinia fructicola]
MTKSSHSSAVTSSNMEVGNLFRGTLANSFRLLLLFFICSVLICIRLFVFVRPNIYSFMGCSRSPKW